jgi:hypothetical protein
LLTLRLQRRQRCLRRPGAIDLRLPEIHRHAFSGIQEDLTMLDIVIAAAGFVTGYVAAIYSWSWLRTRHRRGGRDRRSTGPKILEDKIRGAL